jgi:putative flippase GtrA
MYLSKSTLKQLCKYGISGGIGAGIDFGLYTIIISLTQVNYLIANTISFSLGTFVVYYLQKNWTFQHQSDNNTFLFTKYIAAVILTYIFNNLILIFLVSTLHMNPIIAKIFQIFISFMWGYTINKYFVFR